MLEKSRIDNIIVYHDNLFGDSIGSTEKLLFDFIRILASHERFRLFAVYGRKNGENIPPDIKKLANISFMPFEHAYRDKEQPFRCKEMNPDLGSVLAKVNPRLFIAAIWDKKQFPVIDIPTKIPLMLISPFGDFCTNGNVRKLYVSGFNNTRRLRKKGLLIAEQFFNPLRFPELIDAEESRSKEPSTVVFGRTGRGDSAIFDPISILAFSNLEKEFGEKVRFIYVNPSVEAMNLAKQLGCRRIEFRDWLDENTLKEFYKQIDVFAHSRLDGETVGISIAEALIAQKPVITHVSRKNNDHLFLVRSPFGRVARLGDVEEYYRHMKWFVENSEKIPMLGLKARSFAMKYFDYDLISRKIVKDVKEAVKGYGRPRLFNHVLYLFVIKIRWALKGCLRI